MSCDIEDFTAFFKVVFPRLVKFLRAAGFTFEEAQDAAADAMVDAYRRWAGVRNLTAYVRTTALHSATSQAQRDRERIARSIRGGWTVPELVDPFVSVDERLDAAQQFRGLVRGLPDQQRLVFTWHLDGFKNKEIAEQFEMNPATVASNLRHAKHRLREMLTRQLGELEQEQFNDEPVDQSAEPADCDDYVVDTAARTIVSSGKPDLFVDSYLDTRVQVRVYLWHQFRSLVDIEEIADAAMERLYVRWHTVDDPLAWVIAVARNLALDELRRVPVARLEDGIVHGNGFFVSRFGVVEQQLPSPITSTRAGRRWRKFSSTGRASPSGIPVDPSDSSRKNRSTPIRVSLTLRPLTCAPTVDLCTMASKAHTFGAAIAGTCGVSEVGPVAMTCALSRSGFVLVDQAAEDGLAADLGGTFVGDGGDLAAVA